MTEVEIAVGVTVMLVAAIFAASIGVAKWMHEPEQGVTESNPPGYEPDGDGGVKKLRTFKTQWLVLLIMCTGSLFGQTPEPTVPTSASVQIILDATQAKYPGNEWVKPCGPTNEATACYDKTKPHRTWHVYDHKNSCEQSEGVACDQLYKYWLPVDKPVVVETYPELIHPIPTLGTCPGHLSKDGFCSDLVFEGPDAEKENQE